MRFLSISQREKECIQEKFCASRSSGFNLLNTRRKDVTPFFIVLCTLAIIVTLSCKKIPPAVGRSRDVVIISSTIDTVVINENLQIYNYVPQREKLFNFFFATDSLITSYDKFHTLFLYGSLEDEYINLLLSPDAKQATLRDTFVLFKLNDLWARDQLVAVLAVSEPQYMLPGVTKYARLIDEVLEEHYYSRIKDTYYDKSLDEKSMMVLSTYGFSMDLTEGWLIDTTYLELNFIFIHTHFPDRSVFVFKTPYAGALNQANALDLRDTLTKKYYNGDYILRELTSSEAIEFKEMKGLRMRGVWQNDSLVAGGPFLSYFLKTGDTLLVLDAMLFNPGERKSDYLTGLEVILNSYRELP